MKLYQTKEKNIINLDNVTMIYKEPEATAYKVATISGVVYDMPETFNEEDLERLMTYNDHLL